MRHCHRQPQEENTGIDLTPMLDIVFIMLIFFVVTTSFVHESGVEVNRPQARTARPQAHGNILVAIRPEGTVWVDRHPVDIRALRAAIERLRAENPDARVVIQGDRAAPIGLLVRVMDEIRRGGITRLSIAATPED